MNGIFRRTSGHYQERHKKGRTKDRPQYGALANDVFVDRSMYCAVLDEHQIGIEGPGEEVSGPFGTIALLRGD
jgi:hypothetical protein